MSLLFKGGKNSTWSPELYEEMILVDFRPEDITDGLFDSWTSRGLKPIIAATATPGVNRPTKVVGGGVKFDKDSVQSLTWGSTGESPFSYRCAVTISSCDIAGNSSVSTHVPIFCVNGVTGSNGSRQPYVHYIPNTATYRVNLNDTVSTKTQFGTANTAFTDKNIRIDFRRGRLFHSRVNGVKQTPLVIGGVGRNVSADASFMGANSATTLKADIEIHRIMFLQGEPSDAYIDRLEGYLHWEYGLEAQLPSGHPYEFQRPRVTVASAAEDFPVLYEFDQTLWNDYADTPSVEKFVNRGLTPPSMPGNYKPVFVDEFDVDSVVDDTAEGQREIWFARGWNTGIGIDAATATKSASPTCYVHSGSEIRLRTQYNSAWRTGAMSSVDLTGQGRAWGGPKYMETRFKHVGRDGSDVEFPLVHPRIAFFTSPLWTYGLEQLFWRTRNRIEFDGVEADGLSNTWLNCGSTHVHTPGIVTTYTAGGKIRISSDVNDKIAGYDMKAAQNFIPDIRLFEDGWITHAIDIRTDFTYLIINDKEAGRAPTPKELLEPLYLCVSNGYNPPTTGAVGNTAYTYDIVLDYMRVYQSEDYLSTVPTGFSARPTIANVSNTLTVTPNTIGSQIEYWWYRNGVPLTELTAIYNGTAESPGTEIRCDVRNLALVNQPHSWTAVATIT